MSLGELRELVMDREAWRTAIHGVTKSQTRLGDWTELNWTTPVFWPEGFHGLYNPWGHKSRTWLSDFYFHFHHLCSWFLVAAICDIKEVLFLVCSYFLSRIDWISLSKFLWNTSTIIGFLFYSVKVVNYMGQFFEILNQSFIPGKNLTWSKYMILSTCPWSWELWLSLHRSPQA